MNDQSVTLQTESITLPSENVTAENENVTAENENVTAQTGHDDSINDTHNGNMKQLKKRKKEIPPTPPKEKNKIKTLYVRTREFANTLKSQNIFGISLALHYLWLRRRYFHSEKPIFFWLFSRFALPLASPKVLSL